LTGFGVLRRPPTGTMEIGLYPRVIVVQHFVERTDADPFIDKDRDAITDRKQGVEVMRDHKYGQAEARP
jgi:hypothetical protein